MDRVLLLTDLGCQHTHLGKAGEGKGGEGREERGRGGEGRRGEGRESGVEGEEY